jgi:hypothetical protein
MSEEKRQFVGREERDPIARLDAPSLKTGRPATRLRVELTVGHDAVVIGQSRPGRMALEGGTQLIQEVRHIAILSKPRWQSIGGRRV